MLKQFYSLVIISLLMFISCGFSFAQESEKGRGYYDLGVFSYEEGNYAEAESNLKQALAFSPDNVPLLLMLGDAYLEQCIQTKMRGAPAPLSFFWPGYISLPLYQVVSGLKYIKYREMIKFVLISRKNPHASDSVYWIF